MSSCWRWRVSCLVFLLAHFTRSQSDEGHPLAPEEEECPPCHGTRVNWRNQRKCVRLPYCCRDRAHFEQCLLSPCVNFRLTCPRARYCVPYNCEDRGCSPVYYDADYNELPADKCRVHVFGKDNLARSNDHKVAGRRRGVRLGLDLPMYHAPHEAEKPGTCPGETEDIIRICVAECTADRDCSGRSKCCWNGCVHRCSKPQSSENGPNYLNLPLISDDD